MDENHQAIQQKERGTMASRFGTWWQKIKQHPFITVGIVVALLALIVVIVLGYLLNWHWTGLVPETSEPKQHTKTLWDWMQLLLVPLMLAIGGFWLNQIQKSRDERATAQRDKTEREITLDKQREDLLQTYLDRMSELLLKEKLRSSEVDAEVRNVARVRTITVLTQLDARRIGSVFAFLREAGLLSATSNDNVVSLSEADLRGVNWSHAPLIKANLSGAFLIETNLNDANLIKANLGGAYLIKANLSGAFLIEANLSGAFLGQANLSGADLGQANLSGANLSGANLGQANLIKADLNGAILWQANLSKADLSEADLMGALLREATLIGATLIGTDLSGALLNGADLYQATLSGALLSGADLSGARLDETILKGARYNMKEILLKDEHGKIYVKTPPTQWHQGFDPKAAGATEKNTVP